MIKQKGFSLIFVLAILIVVSFLVASGMRTIKTETAISGGDVDKSVAFHYAEIAANYISKDELIRIDEAIQKNTISKPGELEPIKCTSAPPGTPSGEPILKGVCFDYSNAVTPAWQVTDSDGKNILDSCTHSQSFQVNETGGECTAGEPGNIAWKNPRYIIEPISGTASTSRVYRVTIKAWGKSENTSTIIQAYYSIG